MQRRSVCNKGVGRSLPHIEPIISMNNGEAALLRRLDSRCIAS